MYVSYFWFYEYEYGYEYSNCEGNCISDFLEVLVVACMMYKTASKYMTLIIQYLAWGEPT